MRTTEFLERYHGFIILVVLVYNDLFVAALTNNKTGITPTEIVHAPERINGQEETVDYVAAMAVRTMPSACRK
jgi:hypothetical protein